jgi:hypothetical protein
MNTHAHIQQGWSNVLNVPTDAGTFLIVRGHEIEQLRRYLAVELTVCNIVSPAYTGIASVLDISLFQACVMFYTFRQKVPHVFMFQTTSQKDMLLT